MNYFERLNAIDVSEHVEKKNGLTYLSWAWAWAEVKKVHPDATYKVYKNDAGWFYHTDGKTAWVETGVTIDGIEHVEMLPVMDYRNKSIPVDNITSFDVNKAIQRSLTKACARHGLGLYIYAGEDLPDTPRPVDLPKPTREELLSKVNLLVEVKGVSYDEVLEVGKVSDMDELDDERLEKLIKWLEEKK